MKDLCLSRRKHTAIVKKLKLVCSFNGRFRHRSSDGKLRYTGGESRIISVDPTTLTYSKLRSTISGLFRPENPTFKLKYQLPGSDVDYDCPLVLLTSDDDVRCMVEEYESFQFYGKTSRLWVFVCNNGDHVDGNVIGDGNVDNDDYDDDENFVNLCKNDGFGCGFGVLGGDMRFEGEKLVGHVKCGRSGNSNGFCEDFLVKSGLNGRRLCDHSLRKMVLKQQLLAKQQSQFQCIGGNCDDPLVNLGPDQKFNGQLIELGSQIELTDTTHTSNPNDVNGRNIQLVMGDQNLGGHAASLAPHPHHLNPRNSNMFEETNQSVKFSFGEMADSSGRKQEVGFGQRVSSPYLNRENIILSSQDWNQRIGFSSRNGSHRMVRLDGKPSLAARCYPGLGASTTISKQGQGMRLNYANSSRPFSGQHEYRALETKRLINPNWNDQASACFSQPNKEIIKKQDELYHGVGVDSPQTMENPLINYSDEPRPVKDEVPYEQGSDRGIRCVPDCLDTNMNVMHTVSQNTANLNGMLMCTEGGEELMSNYQTCQPKPVGEASSIDLSSYNPSLSSSKLAPPTPSHAISEVYGAIDMTHLKLLDQVVDPKASAETEGSNRAVLHSINVVMAKALHDETQEYSHVIPSVDGKVDTRESHKIHSMLHGLPSDLAAFYTHLATRELQTIKECDLEYIKELGSGNYGTVFYGKWKGSDVAIKKIKSSSFSGDAEKDDQLVADFWKEAHMLSQLHHPNIVAFYGVVTDGPRTNLATVTEYMINGSLKQVLQRKDRTIDRRKRLIMAMDAAFGMEYLHEKNIVHFDLKSHNFLVNMRDLQRPVCKIGDLGLSKMKKRTLVSGGVRGTIPWMAPELLSTSSNLVTEKVDVYSFGIVMWELLTGEEPYANMRSQEILAGIIKGTLRPEIPSWCDPAWRSLMERCWSSDPISRPSFSEVAKELRAMSVAMNIK